MGCKLLVAPQLEDAHQLIERCGSGHTRGFEPPATFGTTKTPKTLLFNPHQCPAHGRLCRRAPTLPEHMPAWYPPSGEETCCFAITAPLGAAYYLTAVETPPPVWVWPKMRKETSEVYMGQFWMVCRASYVPGRPLVYAHARFLDFV